MLRRTVLVGSGALALSAVLIGPATAKVTGDVACMLTGSAAIAPGLPLNSPGTATKKLKTTVKFTGTLSNCTGTQTGTKKGAQIEGGTVVATAKTSTAVGQALPSCADLTAPTTPTVLKATVKFTNSGKRLTSSKAHLTLGPAMVGTTVSFPAAGPVSGGAAFKGQTLIVTAILDKTAADFLTLCNAPGGLTTLSFTGAQADSTLASSSPLCGAGAVPTAEQDRVREVVSSFYAAFNSAFAGPADFATEDWNDINTTGGWTQGRDNTLTALRQVHATFLSGVTDTVEDMSVRFATCDVAVVVATSSVSPYTTPDGVNVNEQWRSTFVVVKRSGQWLVMQDQATVSARGPTTLNFTGPLEKSTLVNSSPLCDAGAVPTTEQDRVREVVSSFYAAFSSNTFDSWAPNFTTEDWNHISPGGGTTQGRDNVLASLREVHSTFLSGVTDTVEDMSVRFATCDVAVVTATSRVSTYTTPDGVKHVNEQQRRTFVVVERSGRWLVMQDHNTVVVGG